MAVSVSLIRPATFVFGLVERLDDVQFNTFRNCVKGSRWNAEMRANLATPDVAGDIVARLVLNFKVDITSDAREALNAKLDAREHEEKTAHKRLTAMQRKLKKEGKALYPFQLEGTAALASHDRWLLADDMGLGKTVQAIMALPDGAPVVVVCPNIAKAVWVREFARWRPEFKVISISGRGKFTWPMPGVVHVINYDILPKEDATHAACSAGTVLIADEAHYLKSPKSARTRSFRVLSQDALNSGGKAWLLTGTPMLNKPPELWAVLQAGALARDAFGSWEQFKAQFHTWEDTWQTHWGDVRNPEHTRECLARVMTRRLRADVMGDLPEKRYEDIPVALDKKTMRACDAIMEALVEHGYTIDDLAEGKVPFEGISQTRALLACAKIPAMLAEIEVYEEAGEPLVVFSAHRAPIEALEGREGWEIITGDLSGPKGQEERRRIEDAFRRGELRGIAGTIGAMGMSVRFERAAHLLSVDKAWVPGVNAQVESRIEAVTQTRGVVIRSLVGSHDLETRVYASLARKQRIIEGALR